MNLGRRASFLLFLISLIPCSLCAQVTAERLLHASDEPQNWLTYSGSYASQRYSALQQINAANVKNLELKWVFQAQSLQKFETTPLVVDGIMYLTQSPTTLWRSTPRRAAPFGSTTMLLPPPPGPAAEL